MAITLGKDGANPPVGSGVISATYTEEKEVIDVTNRTNAGGSSGQPGFRAYKSGLTSKMWEIECNNATGLLSNLTTQLTSGSFGVMNITENISIDGAVTYTVTLREG
jgi:hypothetical protein